jgi:ABC-type thiamin/hydroxymethylpyrimidine transport system permease subunit
MNHAGRCHKIVVASAMEIMGAVIRYITWMQYANVDASESRPLAYRGISNRL